MEGHGAEAWEGAACMRLKGVAHGGREEASWANLMASLRDIGSHRRVLRKAWHDPLYKKHRSDCFVKNSLKVGCKGRKKAKLISP